MAEQLTLANIELPESPMADMPEVQAPKIDDSQLPVGSQNVQAIPTEEELVQAERQAVTEEAQKTEGDVQPMRFEEEPTFSFMKKEVPEFVDIISYKQDERNFQIALNKYNRGVFDELPALEDVRGAVEYVNTNKFGYKALKANPALIRYYENKGKIGFFETWQRMNKWGILPYAGDAVEIAESIDIYSTIKKANAGEKLSADEESKLQEFAQDMIEIDIRGQTGMGKFLEGAYKMPAFAIEFMTGGKILTELFKRGGMKTAKVAINKGMSKYVKSKIVRGTAKMLGEGAMRTVINPIGVTKAYMDRRLNDSVTVTDKGEIFFREAEESPATTFVKAFGDVFVEQASETGGKYLFPVLGQKLPKGIKQGFEKMTKGELGMSVKQGMSKYGFDGFIEEIGEERLGGFLRATLDLDEEQGWSIDQFGKAMFPSWEDMLVEAGVIGFHGTMSYAGAKVLNRLAGKDKIKSPEDFNRMKNVVGSLTETQRESIMQELEAKETLEDIEAFGGAMEFYKAEAMQAGRPKDEVEAVGKLTEAFIAVTASKQGLTRMQVAEKFLPTVSRETTAPERSLEMYQKSYKGDNTNMQAVYQGDYKGWHTAPIREGNNTLDDVSDILPEDVYDPSVSWRYYGHGGDSIAMDKETARIISKFQGKPDADITIYRAVPKGITEINKGDWVTINPQYANDHGSRHIDGGYDVISKKVKAKDIVTDGNSIHEWGYDPEGTVLNQEQDPLVSMARTFDSYEDFKNSFAKAYHQTSEETIIRRWSTDKAFGRIWFTDNKEALQNVGASGKGKIYEVYLSPNAKWADVDTADRLMTDQMISEGYDGVYHPDTTEDTYYGNYYEVFDPKVINSEAKLKKIWGESRKPVVSQGRKGFFDPANNIIGILPNADRSTFLHETSHAFFQYYLKNMPSELKTIFDWTNMKMPDNLDDLKPHEYVRLQEAFARGFETYLAEGKAPNEGLAKVFEDFRNWLIAVYEYVEDIMRQGGFDFKLSDDVRNLFNEMINVEAERDIQIDPNMQAPAETDLPMAYQTARDRISKLRREKARITKKYGVKDKAKLEEIDQIISDIEKLEVVERPKQWVEEAELEWQGNPISEVFDRKIKITPEYEGMMARYNVPQNVKTTEASASTADELADELDMNAEDMIEEVAKIGSKQKFIDNYVEQKRAELAQEIGIEASAEAVAKRKADIIKQIREEWQKTTPTTLQKEVIKRIRDMDISAVDKVKLLGRIQQAKNINSQKKVMFDLLDMETKYYEKQQRNIISDKIQQLLKKTKPVRKGAITEGRFTYNDNELFKEIRRINKLTQKQALAEADMFARADKTSDDPITQAEALARQFTMYKAFGKSKGSLELFEVTYTNLMKAYRLARQFKEEADFEKAFNKKLKTEKVLQGIDNTKFKGDAKAIGTKLANIYRLGFTNIYSMINSVAGKDVAEALNPELQESRRNTATYEKIKETVKGALGIFDLKNPNDFVSILDKFSQEEYELTEQFERYEGRAITRTFDRMGILDIYNAIKNDKTREDYFRTYGEANVLTLVNKLTEQEKQFADYLMAEVQGYRESVNKKHIEQTGIDMGFIENYWMATSQKPKDTLLDNMKVQGSLPSYAKERATGGVVPIPMNAWLKYSKHIASAEQMLKLQDSWRELRQIFDSNTVQAEIKKKYGDKVNKSIRAQIDGISLNQLTQQMDEVSGFFGKVLGNWIKAKISLNLSVFSKQLISVGNYMENMPVMAWNKYFIEGMANPVATKKFMWDNAKFLEARFNKGYSEDIERAQAEAKKMALSKKYNQWMTSLVRMGDIGAITYGGYPMIQYLTKEKGMTMEQAVAEFEKATLRSQQSGLASSLSPTQMSRNPFVNFFFAFKNTPTQYMRKMADAIIMFRNGDITLEQFTKTMIIYGAIQPAMFGMVTQLMRQLLYDDDDDYVDDVISNIAISPINAIPIVGDVGKFAVNTMIAEAQGDKKPWKVFSSPVMDDIESWVKVLEKNAGEDVDDISIFDFIDMLALPAELTVGAPVQTVTRPFKKRMKSTSKKTTL